MAIIEPIIELNKKTYKIGIIAEIVVEGTKLIQVPVTITEQMGVRHDEKLNEIPITNTVSLTVGINVADIPAIGQKLFLKERIKEAYLMYLSDKTKYEELDGMEFTE